MSQINNFTRANFSGFQPLAMVMGSCGSIIGLKGLANSNIEAQNRVLTNTEYTERSSREGTTHIHFGCLLSLVSI